MMHICSHKYYTIILLFTILTVSCTSQQQNAEVQICRADTSASHPYSSVKGALLGTRFNSLDELRSVVQIEYFNDNAAGDSSLHKNAWVRIRHCSNGIEVTGILKAGISQTDINEAENADLRQQLAFVLRSPYTVAIRKDLEKVFLLSRLRPALFGEGDVAFFNIAQAMEANINTPELAFRYPRDSTEKGYLNTFNHMTAQAFITSCFSEELADFVADAHEKAYHPELIPGKFTTKQVNDLNEGPVDNYVDIINNEWGQELGKQLKEKYHITGKTIWSPELMTSYLNDVQQYYSWALQIGFKPFREEDEQVVKFSAKMNAIMQGGSYTKYEGVF